MVKYGLTDNLKYLDRGDLMDYALTAATWFWLFVPMPLLIVLSIITLFAERGK